MKSLVASAALLALGADASASADLSRSPWRPATPLSRLKDLRMAVGTSKAAALSHSDIDAMVTHDSRQGVDAQQMMLVCSSYAQSSDLSASLAQRFDDRDIHPVFYGKMQDRSCFAVAGHKATKEDEDFFSATAFSAARLPHALKVDPSVAAVAASITDQERFVVEFMFGLGVGGKGLVAERSSKVIADELLARAKKLSRGGQSLADHRDAFFWSSDSASAVKSHRLSTAFAAKLQQHQFGQLCSFEGVHVDIGRSTATITAPKGMNPECMLLLASVGAVHPDVSLVLAHKGYALAKAEVVQRPEVVIPYASAPPPTDQNAFIQSGNSVDKPYSTLGVNGSSYVVGYIDSGVDDLSCFLIDDSGTETPRTPADSYANPTTESWRRKVIQYIAWADGKPSIDYDHGTWCAGSTTGQCINLTSPASGYNGMAPLAKVTMFDVDVADTDNFVNVPSLYDICLPPAYGAGARIHSNSWGTPEMTSYTSKALDVDEFTYENPDFMFVVAASNDGTDGYKSVGSPGVAKNALTVGATAINHDQLVYFSSVGPVYDGSIKPDIVTPGQYLYSAGVRNLTAGQTDSCNVQISSGTSMATPLAAGAGVLVREYLESGKFWSKTCNTDYNSCPVVNPNKPGNFISGALLKAALVHSGEAIHFHQASSSSVIPAGNLSATPDYFQGWGQVLLKNLLPIPGVYDFDLYVADYQNIESLQARNYFFEVTDTSLPLRVTISWTDPANVVWAAKNLLNDLDLMIYSPKGYWYYGNNIKGDEHNPNERIIIDGEDDLEVGYYQITVVSKQLATTSQDFSIVITGIGAVDESRTGTGPAYLPNEYHLENATEACQGTYDKPTGKVLVRFQLEDWQSGDSWIGLPFNILNSAGSTVSTCMFAQNGDNDAAFYTRSSQCSVCLPDDSDYTASLQTSKASNGGSTLIRVATSQCDNVFLSSLQQSASFKLSDGSCNFCPSGFSRVVAAMSANVTDDDYVDYSWYGEANWKMYSISNSKTPVASGTLSISDEEADRYCLPNGNYNVILDESKYYKDTGRHVAVVFTASGYASQVELSGETGVYSAVIELGGGDSTWFQSTEYIAPHDKSGAFPTEFGTSVSQNGGYFTVGAPACAPGSSCIGGGQVSLYEVYSSQESVSFISPDPSDTQLFGQSISMGSLYLAVGAPGDNANGDNSGRVYIFNYENLALVASLAPDAPANDGQFGFAVSLFDGSDNVNIPESEKTEWLAVGAPTRGSGGMVSVYTLPVPTELVPNTTWTLVTDLSPPAAVELDAAEYGRAVSWYNDYLAIGGTNRTSGIGFVVVLVNNYPSIDVVKVLFASDESSGNLFGFSVSLFTYGEMGHYGTALVVGAPGANQAYIFTRNPASNVWIEKAILSSPVINPMASDGQCGYSVGVSEQYVMMGCPGSGGNAGSVVAFLVTNSSNVPVWVQQSVLIPGDINAGDQFGSSTSLSGKNLIVGAPGTTIQNGAFTTGSAYLYVSSVSASPTLAPSSKDDGDDDDNGWSSLDSFNNLAITITVISVVIVVGVAAAVYFVFLRKDNGDLDKNLI